MRTVLVFFCLSFCACPVGAFTLADHGKSSYQIVTAPDASPAEQQAAQELSTDLKLISGSDLPVISQKPAGPAIFVGDSPFLPASFRAIKVDAMPDETIVIRADRRNLYLNGQGARGALYAVYTFLEDHLGVRWYAPDATVMPHQDVIKVPVIKEIQTPGFAYRDTDEAVVYDQAEWDAHLKLDGVDVPDDPKLGGINRLFNGAENFYGLVPPNRYFANHPEYYSLINGKRDDGPGSQLCLSNPDVFKIVVNALVAQAKANPKLLTLGLSPNDAGDGECQCDACKALDAKFGSPSGVLLDFVNRVATAVQAQLPGRKIWLETLAYQYTQKAPPAGAIAPADNVLVCLAPIHACDGHPLATDPPNAESNQALLDWSKVAAGHLQIWHYVTNFANFFQPYPDWDELGADMAYYQANGVSGMFCEGDYQGRAAMAILHTWIMAHLFWNPHQDVWALIQDFCNGYYGKAGPDIYAYLRLFHDRLQQPGVHLYLYDPPTALYLTPDLLQAASALFDRAQAAVADNPTLEGRVEEARMGIEYVDLVTHTPGKTATDTEKAAFRAKLDPFLSDMTQFNSGSVRESGNTNDWIARMKAAAGE